MNSASSRPSKIEKTPLAEQLHGGSRSPLQAYRAKVLGDCSLARLLGHELRVGLFSNWPGGAGYLFRKLFWGNLFRSAGSGLILGKGVTLRRPDRVSLGDRVAVDDNTLLDAGGAGPDGIVLGNDVVISRNCVIQGKSGPVAIGDRSDVGCNAVLTSVSGIDIGTSVLIAAACYIGGARYVTERGDIPFMDQGIYSRGPVAIGDGSWLGANVTVLDGMRIGAGCVVGAGAVVTSDLPPHSIAAGVPARVMGTVPAEEVR
jgi:acetyltransferase-like isoleucine patch superfamily enzyme